MADEILEMLGHLFTLIIDIFTIRGVKIRRRKK